MLSRRSLAAVLALVALTLPLSASAGDEEDAAVEAARAWLALVDAGDYAKSWSEAATLFRGAVTEAGWAQQMRGVRVPLGDVRSRELASAQHTTSLPGAPDGEYVLIQFTTSFANKASAVETVTPMKDSDGRWHVAGYFIR